MAYQRDIAKYAKDYDMEDYIALIMAIMMIEAKGIKTDPIRCSRYPLNNKYPQEENDILDPDYLIKIGIQYLSEYLNKSNVTDNKDSERIYLAVQGFNFGYDYID